MEKCLLYSCLHSDGHLLENKFVKTKEKHEKDKKKFEVQGHAYSKYLKVYWENSGIFMLFLCFYVLLVKKYLLKFR